MPPIFTFNFTHCCDIYRGNTFYSTLPSDQICFVPLISLWMWDYFYFSRQVLVISYDHLPVSLLRSKASMLSKCTSSLFFSWLLSCSEKFKYMLDIQTENFVESTYYKSYVFNLHLVSNKIFCILFFPLSSIHSAAFYVACKYIIQYLPAWEQHDFSVPFSDHEQSLPGVQLHTRIHRQLSQHILSLLFHVLIQLRHWPESKIRHN